MNKVNTLLSRGPNITVEMTNNVDHDQTALFRAVSPGPVLFA